VPLTSGSGVALTTDLIAPNGTVACAAKADDDLDCTAPITGTYTATVRDFYGPGTGLYAITPQRLNNPVGCATLTIGTPISGALSPGTVRCYRMSSTAGRSLTLAATTVPTVHLSPRADMVSPTGTVMCTAVVGTRTCTTPATGTYTITVSDFYGWQSGAFNLSVT
jgi:hypothetical protein